MTLENYNLSPNSDHFSPESDQKYANLLNRNHKSDQIKDIFSDHFPFKSVSQLILINNSGITLANVSDIIIIARPPDYRVLQHVMQEQDSLDPGKAKQGP